MKTRLFYTVFFILCSIYSSFAQGPSGKRGTNSFVFTYGPSFIANSDLSRTITSQDIYNTVAPMSDKFLSLGYNKVLNYDFALKFEIKSGMFKNYGTYLTSKSTVFLSDLKLEYNLFHPMFTNTNRFYVFTGIGFQYTNFILLNQPGAATFTFYGTATSPTIPLGMGYLAYITEKIAIGVEANLDYTFSDLVEGVSDPSNFLKNDMISTLSFVLSIDISKGNFGFRGCNCNYR